MEYILSDIELAKYAWTAIGLTLTECKSGERVRLMIPLERGDIRDGSFSEEGMERIAIIAVRELDLGVDSNTFHNICQKLERF